MTIKVDNPALTINNQDAITSVIVYNRKLLFDGIGALFIAALFFKSLPVAMYFVTDEVRSNGSLTAVNVIGFSLRMVSCRTIANINYNIR